MDGDGDLDAVVGMGAGGLAYFENTGDALDPTFVQRTGGANPFAGASVGAYAAPALADVDGDGDLDLLLGGADGGVAYFENTGDATAATYVARSGGANPFDGFDVGQASLIAVTDFDGDGDADLVAGERYGVLNYFENVGDRSAPSFVERLGVDNPFHGYDVGGYSAPTFADINGDGNFDLVVGESTGELNYFRNVEAPTAPTTPKLALDALGDTPFAGIDVGMDSKPDFDDLDGTKAYLAGPPVMVETVTEKLKTLGVRRQDCHADAFYTEAEKSKLEGK